MQQISNCLRPATSSTVTQFVYFLGFQFPLCWRTCKDSPYNINSISTVLSWTMIARRTTLDINVRFHVKNTECSGSCSVRIILNKISNARIKVKFRRCGVPLLQRKNSMYCVFWVCACSFNKHATPMRRVILSSVTCLTTPFFSPLSHKRQDFRANVI